MNIMNIIPQIVVLLFSVAVHESAHGWMAEKYGDLTARNQGRITLNPIPHLDLMGSVIVPIMLLIASHGTMTFGWAKPVMVNPYNFRNRRKGTIWVAMAGPISNFILGFISVVFFLLLKSVGFISGPDYSANPISNILLLLIFINVILTIFNLIPVPPLDGSKVLDELLKGQAYHNYQKIKPYILIIFFVIMISGKLGVIFNPIFRFIDGILG
jgi:Zn-dependent protease